MEHIDPIKSILLPYLNFAIFLGLLIYFARKPLIKMAQEKRQKFESAQAQALAAKNIAVAKSNELSQRIASLESDVQRIREQTKQDAQKESDRLIASAHELAKNLEVEADRMVQAELLRSKENLREEIVSAVKKTIIERVAHDLTTDKQRSLVRKQMETLTQLTGGAKGSSGARGGKTALSSGDGDSGVGDDAR